MRECRPADDVVHSLRHKCFGQRFGLATIEEDEAGMAHDQHDGLDVDNLNALFLDPRERAPSVEFRIGMPRKVDPAHPAKRLDELLGSGLRMQLAASDFLHALTLG